MQFLISTPRDDISGGLMTRAIHLKYHCINYLFHLKYHCIKLFISREISQYLQINTWAFPYWPGYHPEIPIYGSRDENQANMEMPMY
jgi:hypothetical protein